MTTTTTTERRRQAIADRTEAYDTAGYRAHTRARTTGTLVIAVDGYEQGLEEPGTGAPRWFTICNDHGGCVGHYTRDAAERNMAHPEAWCEWCSGAEAEAEERQAAEVARVEAWTPALCGECQSPNLIAGRCIDCGVSVPR